MASISVRPSRDDARLCERLVRRHARTFSLASTFLPPHKRRATFALYAFCRTADDIVDAAPCGSAGGGSAARALADLEAQLARAVAGRPATPLLRELRWAITEFDVPASVLFELLHGVARDLNPVHYASWTELVHYCEGVASTVGEMCTSVFGTAGGGETRAAAVRYARVLGVAMQLTNILRDVGEDAASRGRCYLAEEDLAAFGVSGAEVLAGSPGLAADPRWRSLMAFLVGRARALYEAAAPGVALLSPDARRCASACALGYAAILGAIERRGYDTLSGRARVSGFTRAGILWDAWRGGTGPGARPCTLRPATLIAPKLVEWA
jgi:phytoene synthase